jgi:uncharacterized protein YidB (DUF937 family)
MAGAGLSGGLGQLIDSFKSVGHAETADSWVNPPTQVEQVIVGENLNELSQRTGYRGTS